MEGWVVALVVMGLLLLLQTWRGERSAAAWQKERKDLQDRLLAKNAAEYWWLNQQAPTAPPLMPGVYRPMGDEQPGERA